MRCLLFAAALALALASAAQARQPDANARPPATTEQIAAARSEADRILSGSDAGDLFENVTTDASPTLRHRRSGMVCMFTPGSPDNNVHVYPTEGMGVARGDDVSCGTTVDEQAITMYATLWPRPTSIREQLTGAVMVIRMRMPDARPAGEPEIGMEVSPREGQSPAPAHQSVTLRATGGGGPIVTRVSIALNGPWVIKQRLTGSGEDVTRASLIGELVMANVLMRLPPADSVPGPALAPSRPAT